MTVLIVALLVLFFGIAILKSVLKIIFLVIALFVIILFLDTYHVIDIHHDIFGDEPTLAKDINKDDISNKS